MTHCGKLVVRAVITYDVHFYSGLHNEKLKWKDMSETDMASFRHAQSVLSVSDLQKLKLFQLLRNEKV